MKFGDTFFCQSTNLKRHRGHGFYKLQTFTVSQTHLQNLGNVNRDSTPYLFKCLLHSSNRSVHFLAFNSIFNVLYSVQKFMRNHLYDFCQNISYILYLPQSGSHRMKKRDLSEGLQKDMLQNIPSSNFALAPCVSLALVIIICC